LALPGHYGPTVDRGIVEMAAKIGKNGSESIIGTPNSDVIYGGNGNDTIVSFEFASHNGWIARAAYYDEADTIFGGNGKDTIITGGGNDIVFGGNGDDLIDGGYDNDTVWGGNGADIFRFEVLYASPGAPSISGGVGENNRDVIADFKQGADLIDISGYQNRYFDILGIDFVGEEQITFNAKTQVGFHYEGCNTVIDIAMIYYNPWPGQENYYSGPSTQIEIVGHVALTESDFILS
jgi:Ca2+-binding RTX toxin-like protein